MSMDRQIDLKRNLGWRSLYAMCILTIALLVSPNSALAQLLQPVITTIAGGGEPASGNGDGGAATSARVSEPVGLAVDVVGNVFVAERYGFTVRKISAAGVISTVAGSGAQMFNGDGIPATSAAVDVRGIAVDAAGNLYIADGSNKRVRKVSTNGIISTIAKSGLNFPTRVAVNAAGTVHVLDGAQVFAIGGSGQLQLVAGNGQYGGAGDGGPATQAQLEDTTAIAFDRSGNLNVVSGERVRRINGNGIIATIIGGGPFKLDPVATSQRWLSPRGAAWDSRGNVYVVGWNNTVQIVNPSGISENAVGTLPLDFGIIARAQFGFSGDGGPAIAAQLYEPEAIVIDQYDNLYIADTRNNRIRKVTPVPAPLTPIGVEAFAPYKTYAVGSYGVSIAIADVTGDGRDDALMLTSDWRPQFPEPANDNMLNLFVQQANGTLAPPLKYRHYDDDFVKAVKGPTVGDLNRDGRMDVVVGLMDGIRVYLGRDSGLTEGVQYKGIPRAQTTHSVVMVDINHDGKLDVVTLSGGRAEGGSYPDDLYGFLYYYGDGSGGFSPPQFVAMVDQPSWGRLQTHDLNGDGLQDLMGQWADTYQTPDGMWHYRAGIAWKLHLPGGGFAATRFTSIEDAYSMDATFAVGDFTADGRKDVVMARSGNAPQAVYALLAQDASGNFKEVRRWQSFDGPQELRAADVNQDGYDDLLVVHSGWHSIGFHAGSWKGLDVEVKYFVDESSNQIQPALVVGDLNGDGCRDVAMGDRNFGLVVLTGIRCFQRVSGSQPRVPPRENPVTTKPPSPADAIAVDVTTSPKEQLPVYVAPLRRIFTLLFALMALIGLGKWLFWGFRGVGKAFWFGRC